jgi:predicted phage terminase large subunit-like protein
MNLTAEVMSGFVGSVLSKRFDEATASPQFHHELWQEACSDYQYVAIAAPRGHAKSTAGTLAYTLAAVLFRQARFVIIVSDTEAQAIMFLGTIKQELQENKDIEILFGLKKNEKDEVAFIKDTESDIVIEFEDGHKVRIIAKGAEQKLRGLNWNGTRPDLIIGDDLENDELVMNKERRTKLRRWFMAALLPAMSPRGRFRMWGTVLHQDSLLESLMPRPFEKTTVVQGLRTISVKPKTMWRSIKYKAHNEDFSEILWPERFGAQFFRDKREEYQRQGIGDVYSQEYLNEPIDESVSYFKKGDLLPEVEADKDKNLRYYIAGDLAISEKETADYTVFVIGGIDEDRVLHIVNIIRERMDGRQIVDTILALENVYEPECIGIEEMQVSKAIGPFLREEMVARNIYPSLELLKHGGKDKLSRARSMQARLRAKSVKFDKESDWYADFEDEILKFPRSRNDDQVDALAYLGLLIDRMLTAPTDEELEEEEYFEELNASKSGNDGRSAFTGY